MLTVTLTMSQGPEVTFKGANWGDIRAQYEAWRKDHPFVWLMSFREH